MTLIAVNFFQLIARFTFVYCTIEYNNNTDNNQNDFLKHKQANINVKSRRFGIIMTQFLRQNE